jgi:hypothetical protein
MSAENLVFELKYTHMVMASPVETSKAINFCSIEDLNPIFSMGMLCLITQLIDLLTKSEQGRFWYAI